MGSVERILARKDADNVLTTTKSTTVRDAIATIADNGVGALVVTESGAVVGIVSERDYLREVALMDRSSRSTPVEMIMSSPVVTVGLTDSVEHCMELMTSHRFRHLPVVEDGVLVGVISIGDCVRQMVWEQSQEIHFLIDYIGGRA